MSDLTPAQKLSRDVYVTIAPHLRSVFADATRDVTEAVLSAFAAWVQEQATECQDIADALTEPTARTIALVRVDTLQRLAEDISHTPRMYP